MSGVRVPHHQFLLCLVASYRTYADVRLYNLMTRRFGRPPVRAAANISILGVGFRDAGYVLSPSKGSPHPISVPLGAVASYLYLC